MQISQIEVGRKYAVREKVSAGEPLIQVQVLDRSYPRPPAHNVRICRHEPAVSGHKRRH